VLVDVLVALVRRPDVREGRQERQVVGIDAVADHVVGGAVRHAEDRIEGRAVALDEGADLDVGDVVEETTAVREAAQVAFEEELVERRVSGETIRATLSRLLAVRWQRAKRWITSPDPLYERKKEERKKGAID